MDDPPPLQWTVHLLDIPPEIQSQIFFHLPSLASVVSLRLACRQLDAVYKANEGKIRVLLRDRLVEPFQDFYECLQRLKFPANSIKYPPPGGWPSIDPVIFKPYNKTDFAIDVLKHLPYVDFEGSWSSVTNIGWKSDCMDYSKHEREMNLSSVNRVTFIEEERLEDDRNYAAEDEDAVCITGAKHIVVLATGHESGGISITLDTFTGIIFETEHKGDDHLELYVRDYCDKRIERFETMQELFHWDEVTQVMSAWDADKPYEYDHAKTEAEGEPIPEDADDEDSRYDWIAYLYHKHGWPGKDYRRDECQQELLLFLNGWVELRNRLYDAERGEN